MRKTIYLTRLGDESEELLHLDDVGYNIRLKVNRRTTRDAVNLRGSEVYRNIRGDESRRGILLLKNDNLSQIRPLKSFIRILLLQNVVNPDFSPCRYKSVKKSVY